MNKENIGDLENKTIIFKKKSTPPQNKQYK